MNVLVLLSLAACAVAAPATLVAAPAPVPAVGYAYSAPAPLVTPYSAYYGPYASPFYNYASYTPYSYPYGTAPVATVVKSQYHMQDAFGQASYGFSEPQQSQAVVRDAAGNQVGSFSYVNPDGKIVHTNFVADALGYRVESNDLPVGPAAGPEPVQDTPEVAEAKAKFMEEFEKTKSRSRRSVFPADTAPLATPVVAKVATPVGPTPVIATPAGTPVAYSHPMAYAHPLAYSHPLAYNTPVAHHFAYPYSYPYNTPYNPYGYVY